MNPPFLSTLSAKGQITLPKTLREFMHLEPGEHIILETAGEGVLIKKAKVSAADDTFSEADWDELKQLANQKGRVYKSGDALLKSLR